MTDAPSNLNGTLSRNNGETRRSTLMEALMEGGTALMERILVSMKRIVVLLSVGFVAVVLLAITVAPVLAVLDGLLGGH